MSGSGESPAGPYATGRMPFWVIRRGNPDVDGWFLNTPSPKSGRVTGACGILGPNTGSSMLAANAAVAGSGGGPV